MIFIVCKAKDLKREITLAWHGIGKVWTLDETDKVNYREELKC